MADDKQPAIDVTKTAKVSEWKHDRPLLSCRFDPGGKFCFTGAHDEFVQRWDMTSGEKLTMRGHRSWVRSMDFRPQQPSLYSGDYAGSLIEWAYQEKEPKAVRTIPAHDGWVRTVCVTSDGKMVATGGNDNLVRVWSTETGEKLHEFAGHERHVYSVTFHPDGKQLVSADLIGVIKHWNLETGKAERELDAKILTKYDKTFRADCGGIRRMQFSPDHKLLACCGVTNVTNAFAGIGNPMVLIYDWESGKLTHKLVPETEFSGFAWGLVWHPDGFVIGVGGGGSGGTLWFWKPDQEKSFFTFKLPNQGFDVDLHPDGKRLAVAHFDSTLRIYSLAEPTA